MHIGHMIANATVHGLIYATIFKLSHQIGMGGMILLSVVVIAVVWIIARSLGAGR